MTEKEQIQKNVEEFSRLQDYMVDSDKESTAYKKMKKRYIELKVILTTFGVNLTELDYIKEQQHNKKLNSHTKQTKKSVKPIELPKALHFFIWRLWA